jgi:hypothetical protein
MTMEQTQTLPQIRAALMDKVKMLQELSDQAYHLETQIKGIVSGILSFEKGHPKSGQPRPKMPQRPSNIIPFPGPLTKAVPVKNHRYKLLPFLIPIAGQPDKSLPAAIPDFRPLLQRDGLILLSWDNRISELGERYTAYWVTSAGPCRYYASRALNRRDFALANPDHKSYAAEDGIEYYGQTSPSYVVHVAPELMMNSPVHIKQRPEHIKKLRDMGNKADFEYRFLLSNSRNRII